MKSVLNIHWKDWCWSWSFNPLATWCEELTHWKGPWCWARLNAGGGGDDRGWDGWMASPTRRTWVWTSYRSWRWTRKPGVLQSMGSQRIGHDWPTELNWTEGPCTIKLCSQYTQSQDPRKWEGVFKILASSFEISNHSILKEINSEYSMEELMLKLKLQYFGHLMWRADPLEKTLMLMKGCCWRKIRRDSCPPEEKNSILGQRWGLIAQSFCVIKFY